MLLRNQTLEQKLLTRFLRFPFQLIRESCTKNRGRSSRGNTCGPELAKKTLVSKVNETSSSRTTDTAKGKASAQIAIPPRAGSSPAFQVSTSGLSLVGESLCEKGLRKQTLRIIMASWWDSTQKQYAGNLQKWQRFRSGRKVEMFSPPVEEVLHFLTELLEANCGYSALNIARRCIVYIYCLAWKHFCGESPSSHKIYERRFPVKTHIP